MKTRILLLTLLCALAAGETAAQSERGAPTGRTLTAFRSEAELRRFLTEHLREPPGRRASPQPACSPAAQVRVRSGARADAADSAVVIRGRVRDGDGAPLAGVQLQVQGKQIGAVTSATGEYRLTVPTARLEGRPRLTVRATMVGYGPYARSFAVGPRDWVTADFTLCAQAVALESVVVSAAPMTAMQMSADAGAPSAAGRAAGGESVTNVQHAGVDEGGIVKVHGDHLVILRRGRLFTVRIGGDALRPVSAADAFGPGIDPSGAWYDELLISGDVVIVIGYSYARGGTEVGLFRIDRAGRLEHRSTYQLRSNDYYSSRNYASRLVEGRLVFYTPLMLRGRAPRDGDDLERLLPALRRWDEEGEQEFRPIASLTRIYRPARELERGAPLALHTVTSCEVARAELECEATAVFGPWGHTFYVSPTSVYVWLSGWRRGRDEERAPGTVYRMPLSGRAPTALGVAGSPIDQFSFLESEDGHLNVLVRAGGQGQWMWRAEPEGGELALLRVPLARFGDGSADAGRGHYRELPAPGGGALHNRFVGDHLLYGAGSGWRRPQGAEDAELFVAGWRDGRVATLPLGHPVDRIEPMGSGAVVVGADARDLHFTSVRLGAPPAAVDRYTLADATQGELRSHGFFYRGDDAQSGLLGLPVRGAGRPGYEHLFRESASILFLRNRSLRLSEMGELTSRPPARGGDGCRASCVDWYGNARPLFLRGRVFALLGYEIVEGAVENGRIDELRRVSFAPTGRGARGP